jgi:uncharacterized protein YdhG (YjbR/CyaY superfamily)
MATAKKTVTKTAKPNTTKASAKPVKGGKAVNDTEAVSDYMDKLVHPLKAEIEAVRTIIKSVDKKLGERVKWNAPSYYYKQDLVTFNNRAQEHVHLVFHHIAIVSIKSDLLIGDYKDRRMMYFKNMSEVKAHKKELVRIMQELVAAMDKEA